MQVHGIHGCRLVHKEVVEALSNYKKSYFWWYVNPACGDSTGSKWIEKDQACVSPRPVWGKRGEGAVWFSVCGAPLDDWANGGYVNVLFTCGECGFSSFVSWSFSEEYVWDWVTKGMLHCFSKWDVSRVTLQEFNISYRLF